MAKTTKTMQRLLDRGGPRAGDCLEVPFSGIREFEAAKALVAAGLAKGYDWQAGTQRRVQGGVAFQAFYPQGEVMVFIAERG